MVIILDLDESALSLKVLDDSLSRLVSVHAGVFRIVVDYLCVIGQDIDNGQVMAQTDLKVVRVMRGGYLNDTGTEVYLDIIIGDNGYLAVDYGQDERLADDILISFIIGVDGNSGIAEQGLGSGRCKLRIAASVLERIAKMPEVTRLILIFDLGVGDRSQAMGAPVDYSLAPVNESLFIEVAENLVDSLIAALVEGEALALPVAGRAHLLELFDYSAAELLFPRPGALEEAFTADIVLCKAFLCHSLDYFRLGGDRSVVGAGQPEGIIALHAVVADKYILKSIVKSMTHMELTRDVRRGNNYSIGFLLRVGYGVEEIAVEPEFIGSVLHFLRIILFCEFLCHNIIHFSGE